MLQEKDFTASHFESEKVSQLETQLGTLMAVKAQQSQNAEATINELHRHLDHTSLHAVAAEAAAVACRLEIETLQDENELSEVVIFEIKEKERKAEEKARTALAECEQVSERVALGRSPCLPFEERGGGEQRRANSGLFRRPLNSAFFVLCWVRVEPVLSLC